MLRKLLFGIQSILTAHLTTAQSVDFWTQGSTWSQSTQVPSGSRVARIDMYQTGQKFYAIKVYSETGPMTTAPNGQPSCYSTAVVRTLNLDATQRIKNIAIFRFLETNSYYSWYRIEYTLQDGSIFNFDASTTTPANSNSIQKSQGVGYQFTGFLLREVSPCQISGIYMYARQLTCNPSVNLSISLTNFAGQTQKLFSDPQNTRTIVVTDSSYGDCGALSYQFSYTPSSSTTNLISFTQSTKTVVFAASSNTNDAMTYTIQIKVYYSTGAYTSSSYWKSATATYTYVNPCATTNLLQPSPSLTAMSVSVLNVQTQTQAVGVFLDQFSVDNVFPSSVCGSRTYSISSAISTSATQSLSTSDLSINPTTGLISLKTSNSATIGTHTATVVARLASYTSVSVSSTFTITINPCVITSLQISSCSGNTVCSLNAQTYYIKTSFSYQLYTVQTPNCQHPATGWIIAATGPNPSNLGTITNSGAHTITPALVDKTQVGSYNIQITAVVLNGITYGPQTTISFTGSSSYALNVQTGCSLSSQVVTAQTVPSITVKVFDPIAFYPATAFPDFTDYISTNRGDSALCPKTYSVIYNSRTAITSLTTITVDSPNRKFQIYSGSMNQIGQHKYVVRGAINEATQFYADYNYLIINVNDPCPSTTLIQPTTPTSMSTSVLLGSTVTRQLGAIKDQLSVSFGDTSGVQFCGSRQYSISSVAVSPAWSLSAQEISISNSGLISLKTDLTSKIGTHQVTVTCSLTNYPQVTPIQVTFTVTINPCVVTSVLIQQPTGWIKNGATVYDLQSSYTYTLSSINSFTLQLSTKQTPNCGYTASNWAVTATGGPSPTNFQTIQSGGLYIVSPTTDTTQTGTYTVQITSVTVGGTQTFTTSPGLAAPSSFNLIVQNPCLGATVYKSAPVSDITVFIEDPDQFYPNTQPAFADFTDSISILNNAPGMCQKTYSVVCGTCVQGCKTAGSTLDSCNVDQTTKKIRLDAGSISQKGVYQVTLKGAITGASTRFDTSTFKVFVYLKNDPCFPSILYSPSPAPTDMTTSVLVQQSIGGPPKYETQTIEMITDSYSLSIPGSNGADQCGNQQFTISSVPSSNTVMALSATQLTIDSDTRIVSVYTGNKNNIGVHQVTVIGSLVEYPWKTITITFTIQINPCQVTQLTMNDLSPNYDRTYTLLDNSLIWYVPSATIMTQIPACGYSYQLSSPTLNSLVNILSGSTLTLQVPSSRNKTDIGKVITVQVDATVTNYDFNPPLVPPTCPPKTLQVTIADPCLTTQINIIPKSIEDLVVFTGFRATSTQVYTFQDSVSQKGILPTDLQDYCGAKDLTFTLNYSPTNYILAFNKDVINVIIPQRSKLVGVQQAGVVATMNSIAYNHISSKTIWFSITVLDCIVPTIPNQLYILTSKTLFIPTSSFDILPKDYNPGPNQIKVFILKSKTVPRTLSMNCGCLTQIDNLDWIKHDEMSGTISVESNNTVFAGNYTIIVAKVFEKFPDVVPFTSFKLIIKQLPVLVVPVIKKAPYFNIPLTPVTVVQCPGLKDDLWSYQIPDYTDPNDRAVQVEVSYDEQFFTYYASTQYFEQIIETQKPVKQTIYITLSNELNLKATYSLVVSFVCFINKDLSANPLLREKFVSLSQQTSWPTAQIYLVEPDGLLRIKFNKVMKVPDHVEIIKNEAIILNETTYPILDVYIQPGQYSDIAFLKFNWTLTSFTPSELKLQLDFENVQQVSINKNDPDQVKVIFYGFYFFADSYGNYMMPPTETNLKILPKLYSQTAISSVKTQASVGTTSVASVLLINTITTVVLSGSVQQILSSVKQLQVLVHLLLVNVAYPATATIILSFVLNMLTFQFYNFSDFYNKIFGFQPNQDGNQPLNEQFNLMGYQSRYIVQNFGTLCWTILFAPAAYLLAPVVIFITRGRFAWLRQKTSNLMFYNYWVGLLNETFLFLSMCTALNFGYFQWQRYGDGLNSFISILVASFIGCFTIFTATYYWKENNYNRIINKDRDFLAQYGAVLEGLNFKRQGKLVIVFTVVSQIRKLSLAYILVFQQERPVFSIFFITFQSLIMMTISGYIEPMVEPTANKLDLINEAFVLLFTYHLYELTDFMTDTENRVLVGTSLVLLTCINIFINLWIIMSKNFKICGQKLKLRFLLCKQKTRKEKENKKAKKQLKKQQKELEFYIRYNPNRTNETQLEQADKQIHEGQNIQEEVKIDNTDIDIQSEMPYQIENIYRQRSTKIAANRSDSADYVSNMKLLDSQKQSYSNFQNQLQQLSNSRNNQQKLSTIAYGQQSLRNQAQQQHNLYQRSLQNARQNTSLIQSQAKDPQSVFEQVNLVQLKPQGFLRRNFNIFKQQRSAQIQQILPEPGNNEPLHEILSNYQTTTNTLMQETSKLHGSEVELLEVYFDNRLIRYSILLDGDEYSYIVTDYQSQTECDRLKQIAIKQTLELLQKYPKDIQEAIDTGQLDKDLQIYEIARQRTKQLGHVVPSFGFQDVGQYNTLMSMSSKVKLYKRVKKLKIDVDS